MVGVGINLFGLSAGSNTKHSITQSPGSTRSLGLSLTDPTDIDRGWTPKLTRTAADDPVSLSVLTNSPSLSAACHNWWYQIERGRGGGQRGRAGRYRIRGWLGFSVLCIFKSTFWNAQKRQNTGDFWSKLAVCSDWSDCCNCAACQQSFFILRRPSNFFVRVLLSVLLYPLPCPLTYSESFVLLERGDTNMIPALLPHSLT